MKYIIIFLALMCMSCTQSVSSTNEKWTFVKSEHTQICYEILTFTVDPSLSYQGFGFMGMSPVDDKYCD